MIRFFGIEETFSSVLCFSVSGMVTNNSVSLRSSSMHMSRSSVKRHASSIDWTPSGLLKVSCSDSASISMRSSCKFLICCFVRVRSSTGGKVAGDGANDKDASGATTCPDEPGGSDAVGFELAEEGAGGADSGLKGGPFWMGFANSWGQVLSARCMCFFPGDHRHFLIFE